MDFIKGIFNVLSDPRLFFILGVAALVFMIWKREIFARNTVGYGLLAFAAVFIVFGYFDPNFKLIILKPDNVPISGLILLLIFFTWLSMSQAYKNDELIDQGKEITPIFVHGQWCEIDTLQDLENARKKFN